MKNRALLLFIVFLSCQLYAQGPIFIACPTDTLLIADTTENHEYLWSDLPWWDALNMSHNLAESAVDLSFSGVDSNFTGDQIALGFALYLDLNQDGMPETLVHSDSLQVPGSVSYDNLGPDGGTQRTYDNRGLLIPDQYQFTLVKTLSGLGFSGSLQWNTVNAPNDYVVPQLPYGRHKIQFFASNPAGEMATCAYFFEIKDGLAPVLEYANGLSLSLSYPGILTIYATDLYQSAHDNYQSPLDLQYAMRVAGTGTGFPLDSTGQPNEMITLGCADLGLKTVEMWARDAGGNAGFCTTEVEVFDPSLYCQQDTHCVKVKAYHHCNDSLVALQVVDLNPGPSPPIPGSVIDSAGCVTGLQFLNDPILGPIKDGDDLNGISTLDLVLISRHVLNVELLDSPYSMIAADGNNSGHISTRDIVEIQKLILGISDHLPNQPSWKFIPKSFTFPNPSNPFQTGYPQVVAVLPDSSYTIDFWAIKVGDVNCSAISGLAPAADDRDAQIIKATDCLLSKGQTITIPFYISGENLYGFQFEFAYSDQLIRLGEVNPGNLPGLQTDNFGQPRPGQLSCSWFNVHGRGALPEAAVFYLTITAVADGWLSEALHIRDNRIKAEAYGENDSTMPLQLFWKSNGSKGSIIQAPVPNPTAAGFEMCVETDQPDAGQLAVYDGQGHLVFLKKLDIMPGAHRITAPEFAFLTPGPYIWKLSLTTNSREGIILKN